MVLAVGAMAVFACGNGANDPAGCRTLENARCARAQECGIDLMYPLHAGDTAEDAIQACQDYYNVACDHGFVTTANISLEDISGCATAITNGSCNIVINPQLALGCSWLLPPDAGVDAPVDVVVSDVTVIVTTTSTSTTTGDAGESEDAAFHDCVNACDQMCASDTDCMTNCESDCANGS